MAVKKVPGMVQEPALYITGDLLSMLKRVKAIQIAWSFLLLIVLNNKH